MSDRETEIAAFLKAKAAGREAEKLSVRRRFSPRRYTRRDGATLRAILMDAGPDERLKNSCFSAIFCAKTAIRAQPFFAAEPKQGRC